MDSIIFNEGSVGIPAKATSHSLINTLPYLEWELPESVVKSLIAFKTFFLQHTIKNVNYDTNFAQYLTEELSPQLDPILKFDLKSPFDWQDKNPEEYNVWGFEGISPLFEFYTLRQHDHIGPHYDQTTYVENDNYIRTLMSGVIFLDDHTTSAHTLIDDKTLDLPYTERSHDGTVVCESPASLLSWALPQKGKVIVYPSKLCHSVLPVLSETSVSFVKFHIFYNAMSKETV